VNCPILDRTHSLSPDVYAAQIRATNGISHAHTATIMGPRSRSRSYNDAERDRRLPGKRRLRPGTSMEARAIGGSETTSSIGDKPYFRYLIAAARTAKSGRARPFQM
jgi:hypothetical protein